jgi:hypothetical protein
LNVRAATHMSFSPEKSLSDYIRYYVVAGNQGPRLGGVSQVEALAQSVLSNTVKAKSSLVEERDDFIDIFNQERPHEALDMKCPAEVYQPSTRAYKALPDLDYPFHDKTIVVTNCGRICLGRKKINFSTVFAGQAVGIKELHDDIWLVSFMDYDLGYFDLDTRMLEPLDNPFGPRLLPM